MTVGVFFLSSDVDPETREPVNFTTFGLAAAAASWYVYLKG
jgi:hypothetical protein